MQRTQLAQRHKVDVVGTVDGLRDAEDGVSDGDAAAQLRGIFDVVDAVNGSAVLGKKCLCRAKEVWDGAYRSEAVCSIPTTRVMIWRLSGGTCSQALKAAMSCVRMSLPG